MKPTKLSVKIGSLWRETDPRFVRTIRVVAKDGDRVQIETVSQTSERFGNMPKSIGRKTWAKLSRFSTNGSRGYRPWQG